jgi:RNA polymerase sigma-70 factor (ECF subfamily)
VADRTHPLWPGWSAKPGGDCPFAGPAGGGGPEAAEVSDPSVDGAISRWMAEWGSRLVRYAHFLTGDPDLAQDIAQEAFLRLYVFLGSRRGREPTPGWLFTVAKHLAADASRRQRRESTRADGAGFASGGEGFREDSTSGTMVRDILSRLAPEDRECLYLFYYADLSSQEIARHLKIPAATVRGRLMRARRRFQSEWEGDGDGGNRSGGRGSSPKL